MHNSLDYRGVDIIVGHDFHNREKQQLELDVTGGSEIHPSRRRYAASPRSPVSSSRLYGAHNSGIAGGHGHAVGVTIATVGGCRTNHSEMRCVNWSAGSHMFGSARLAV